MALNKVPTTMMSTGALVQTAKVVTTSMATTTTIIPYDDTIPTSSEGAEFMSLAITPKATTNKLRIHVVVHLAQAGGSDHLIAALFQDAGAAAIAVGWCTQTTANYGNNIKFSYEMDAGTTSATTFRVRGGGASAGTVTFNGGASARKFGGVLASSIFIEEIAV